MPRPAATHGDKHTAFNNMTNKTMFYETAPLWLYNSGNANHFATAIRICDRTHCSTTA
jgi:hypothetical protein